MCVMCRRESRAPAPVPRWIFVMGGLTLLLLGGIFVVKSLPPLAPAAEPVAANPESNLVEAVEPAAPAPAFLRDVVRPEPPTRAQPTSVSPGAAPAPTVNTAPPTQADVMAALKQVPITMYSTTWCPHCERARRWFQSNAIPFVDYDVEENSAAKSAQRKLNPKGGVPTIDIDGTVEVGFSEQRVGKAIARSVQRRLRERTPTTKR
jgi:glutaredoxin 3